MGSSQKGRGKVGTSVAMLMVGLLMGSVMLSPVGAHIKNFNHLKAKHFYTKKASNARFLNVGEAYTKAEADAKYYAKSDADAKFIDTNEADLAKRATSTLDVTTSSTTFVDLAGATTSITVPSGSTRLVLASFTAESQCTDDGNDAGFMPVRILIGGAEGDPAAADDFAFDSCKTETSSTPDKWESHSVDRSLVLGPGTYAVQVQWMVTEAADAGRLDDWHLTAQMLATA